MATITLNKDKDTKRTVRFTVADGDGPITGSLYVSKEDERSKGDTLTIEVAEAA